jgi:hypothetical protein
VQGQLLAAGLRWQWAYFPQWIGANSAQRWIWRGFEPGVFLALVVLQILAILPGIAAVCALP